MAVLHIVLWNRAVVLHLLRGEVILRIPLLEQGAALVFLIRQKGLDRAVMPDVVSGGTFDARLYQLFCDGGAGQAGKVLGADVISRGFEPNSTG